MTTHHYIPIKGHPMTTYVFRVVVEPDDDAWHAYCPALRTHGATTWGSTEEEALKHIEEVVRMVVAELVEDNEAIPDDVYISREPLVSVTV
jgi:predicted RNase H-like HicB family nuclease